MSASSDLQKSQQNSLVISYLTLRRMLGIIGIAFPLVLYLGSIFSGACETLQPTISDYYHTKMRDVFVAVICIIAMFLFTYRGYDTKDRIICKLAAFCAFGVAFFPTAVTEANECTITPLVEHHWVSTLHLVFAASFFLLISFISIFQFVKSGKNAMTTNKIKRNRIYRICGGIMIASIIGILVYWKMFAPNGAQYRPVFFLESIALVAFGISWLVKGEFLLSDESN